MTRSRNWRLPVTWYVTVRGSAAGGGAATVGAVLGAAAVGVGDTLVMVSRGSAVADGALGEGAALGYGTALLVEGETVADVVPLSPPLRIISVPATAMSRTMPATLATHSQRRSSGSWWKSS